MFCKNCAKYSLESLKVWLKSKSHLSLTSKLLYNNYSTKTRSPVTDQLIVRSPYNDIIIPNKTFTELIWEQHTKWSNKKAVTCGLTGEGYTYSKLKEHADLIGQCLIDEGLRCNDVLALILPNSPEYISIILGASARGLTLCSMNPLYTADEIAHQIKNSGAKMIVTFPDKLQDVLKAVNILKVSKCLAHGFKVLCSNVMKDNNVTIPKDVICLNDLLDNSNFTDNYSVTPTKISKNSLALISHSSGTTGLPKGVCLTQKNVTAAIFQMAFKPTTVFQETDENHQDVLPMFIPIFHNFGLIISLSALYHGTEIVTLPKFEVTAVLSMLKKHKADLFFLVPPIALFLGSNPLVTKKHLEKVRCFFSAAAPIGSEDIHRCLLKASSDARFIIGYGLTEATCALTQVPYNHKKYDSIGIPLTNTEMKVVDLNTRKRNRSQEEGEICFRGPQTSLGYLNNPEENKKAFDEEGWFCSGDIGYYDDEGFFYVVDRMKDLIKVKGFQVAPAELEHVLRSCPGIEEAAVIGASDTRKGEVPVGFIKKKAGSTVDERSIREFLAEKVAPFKMIEKYFFVDTIPTNPSGKILRKQLKKMFIDMDQMNDQSR